MKGSVRASGLSKSFVRHDQQRPKTLKQHAMRGFRRGGVAERFWAVRDINFEVSAGRMLGVVGHNGSGKSTLLRMVGGVMRPDKGRVETSGKLSGLLALNTGMHAELTGRDNVLIGGVIAGLTRAEVQRRMDEIVRFAELEEFIDNPVRTYSTGMRMRLGFSVAIHTRPDVLLIDEVLSVGDMAFQAKCLDHVRRLKTDGCAIILITHDLSQAEKLCDEVLWMRHGEMVAKGAPEVVLGEYRVAMKRQTRERTPLDVPARATAGGAALQVNENRFGSLELEITEVKILDRAGFPTAEIESGAPLSVQIRFKGPPDLLPIVGVSIGSADGGEPVDLNTLDDEVSMQRTGEGGVIRLDLDRVDLTGGDYFVNVGLYHPNWDYAYDYHWRVYPLQVNSRWRTGGAVSPPRKWVVLKD
jgi:lipopolysaccharide transport system ATP-binding protein